ncbi:MAG: hypothetical protein MI923_11265 [Phycisphaerales bacterium]|nr:hypothetical protein [Phycisphaerales bacterium]
MPPNRQPEFRFPDLNGPVIPFPAAACCPSLGRVSRATLSVRLARQWASFHGASQAVSTNDPFHVLMT